MKRIIFAAPPAMRDVTPPSIMPKKTVKEPGKQAK